jgi:hypothetical protein
MKREKKELETLNRKRKRNSVIEETTKSKVKEIITNETVDSSNSEKNVMNMVQEIQPILIRNEEMIDKKREEKVPVEFVAEIEVGKVSYKIPSGKDECLMEYECNLSGVGPKESNLIALRAKCNRFFESD